MVPGCGKIPRSILIQLPEQAELYYLLPITLGAGWLAFTVGPVIENTLMGGSFRDWLLSEAGQTLATGPDDGKPALVAARAAGD